MQLLEYPFALIIDNKTKASKRRNSEKNNPVISVLVTGNQLYEL